jgi:phospho-N-acetylmuramoyl-pentapeptide-transferase
MNVFSVPAMLIFYSMGILAITLWAGARLVPLLQRFAIRQYAYEDAPATHAVKTGTPTMGGLLFLLALVIAVAASSTNASTVALVVLGLGCGAIGFFDDYLSIRRGKNRGMRARTKLLLTAIVALLFLWLAAKSMPGARFGSMYIWLPGGIWPIPILAWGVLGFVTILATTHAVNLTDGLDGLLGGSILPPLAVFAAIEIINVPIRWRDGMSAPQFGALVVTCAIFAAVLGFLYFNVHPARLFMGDTGSLTLGGILAGSAILLGTQFLLIAIGGVFVAETLSVILQVASFKLTGKRIFRMSPLHHHFELAGWPEEKVTLRFWAASALCSAVGVALYLIPVIHGVYVVPTR